MLQEHGLLVGQLSRDALRGNASESRGGTAYASQVGQLSRRNSNASESRGGTACASQGRPAASFADDEAFLSAEVWTTGKAAVDLTAITDAIKGLCSRLRGEQEARRELETRVEALAETAEKAFVIAQTAVEHDDGDLRTVDRVEEGDCDEGGKKMRPKISKQVNYEGGIHYSTKSRMGVQHLNEVSETYGDDDDMEIAMLEKQKERRREARLLRIETDITYHRKQLEQKIVHDDSLLEIKLSSMMTEVERRLLPADMDDLRNQLLGQMRSDVSLECRSSISAAFQDKTAILSKQVDTACQAVTHRLVSFEEKVKQFEAEKQKEEDNIKPLEDMIENHQRRLEDLARRVHGYKTDLIDLTNKLDVKHEQLAGHMTSLDETMGLFGKRQLHDEQEITSMVTKSQASRSTDSVESGDANMGRTTTPGGGHLERLKEDLMKDVRKDFQKALQALCTGHHAEEIRRTLEGKINDQRLILEAEAERRQETMPEMIVEECENVVGHLRKEIAEVRASHRPIQHSGIVSEGSGGLRAEVQEMLEDAKVEMLAAMNSARQPVAPSVAAQTMADFSGRNSVRKGKAADRPFSKTTYGIDEQFISSMQAMQAANAALRERLKMLEARLTAMEVLANAGEEMGSRLESAEDDAHPPELTTPMPPRTPSSLGPTPDGMRRSQYGRAASPFLGSQQGRPGSGLTGGGGGAGSGRSHAVVAELMQRLTELTQRWEDVERVVAEQASSFVLQASQTASVAEDGRKELENVTRAIRGIQRQGEQSVMRIDDIFQDQNKLSSRMQELMTKVLGTLCSIQERPNGNVDAADVTVLSELTALADSMGTNKKVEAQLENSLGLFRSDIVAQLGQLRTEMQDNLVRKANRIDLQSLITKVHCMAGPEAQPRPLRSATPEVSSCGAGGGRGSPDQIMFTVGENAAGVKWPRCLSCDTPVEVITDGGRLKTVAMVPSRMASPPVSPSPRCFSATPPPVSPSPPPATPTLPPAPGAAPVRPRSKTAC